MSDGKRFEERLGEARGVNEEKSRRGRANVDFTTLLRVGATCREVAHAASNDARVESLLFFPCLTRCSGWWDGGAERKRRRQVCMYVRWLPFLSFHFHFLSPLSPSRLPKRGWIRAVSGGWASRTGVRREVSNRSGSCEGLSTWTCRGKRTDV